MIKIGLFLLIIWDKENSFFFSYNLGGREGVYGYGHKYKQIFFFLGSLNNYSI